MEKKLSQINDLALPSCTSLHCAGGEYWWSRRESNPRPQAITGQFYMRSWLI